jgi:S-DNA-T family DNA segregation ATPase FtsK/SpoIIIE
MSWYVELLERHGVAEPVPEPGGLETDILDELRDLEAEVSDAEPEEIKGDWDDLFRSAAEICIQNGGGSTSLLQRRLSIGYGRAARIVDQLQDAGVLGPSEGAKGREVLMGLDELEAMFGGRR